jgi:hypothetical protein
LLADVVVRVADLDVALEVEVDLVVVGFERLVEDLLVTMDVLAVEVDFDVVTVSFELELVAGAPAVTAGKVSLPV